MRSILMLCAVWPVCVAGNLAAAETLPQRPMDQMHGGCDNFAWDLSQEFKVWSGEPLPVSASVSPDATSPAQLDRKLDVALHPHGNVRFLAPPETNRGGPGKYSGLLEFTLPSAGTYRISASNGLWIDVVHNDRLIPSKAFEMQTECRSVFKSVAYEFPANAKLKLQLNGSASRNVFIAITRARN